MRRNQKPTQLKRKSETTCGCVVRNSQLLMSIVHSHTTFFLNRANLHKFCLLPKFWREELGRNFSTRKEDGGKSRLQMTFWYIFHIKAKTCRRKKYLCNPFPWQYFLNQLNIFSLLTNLWKQLRFLIVEIKMDIFGFLLAHLKTFL